MTEPNPEQLPMPDAELILADVEQLKAIADPLRLRLLELMTDDAQHPWSAKELAERLGTGQTKLYHHLALLEERGLIRVAGTRIVSGIQEKRYQVSALSFRVDRLLLSGDDTEAALGTAIDAIFGKARTEILSSARRGAIRVEEQDPKRRRMALWASHARLSDEGLELVMRQIEKLASIDDHNDPDGADYGLVLAFYPRPTEDTDR